MELDLTNVKDEGVFSPIPEGEYPACVDSVEWKESKAGAEYLNVKFKITGDNYANRLVFNIYNVFNTSEKARNIALADIKKLLTANGETEMKYKTKEELAAKVSSCKVILKVGIRGDSYGEKNTIKGYKPLTVNSEVIPF